MPRRAQASLLLVAPLAAVSLFGEARSEVATSWTIATQKDKLTERVTRFAVTMPKSDPIQQGKSVTIGLIIKCGKYVYHRPDASGGHDSVLVFARDAARQNDRDTISVR